MASFHLSITLTTNCAITRTFEAVVPTHTHGDSRASGRYENTSIWVPGLVDIHVMVDPTVHSGYTMMQEDTGACMGIQETYLVEHGDLRGEQSSPLQQHKDLGDNLLNSINHMNDDRGGVIDHQYVESPTVVHNGMRLVWSPDNYSPSMLVDDFFVKPLGLTKAYDTSQSYIQLQVFMLPFLDTFIIYNSIGEDSQLHGT